MWSISKKTDKVYLVCEHSIFHLCLIKTQTYINIVKETSNFLHDCDGCCNHADFELLTEECKQKFKDEGDFMSKREFEK